MIQTLINKGEETIPLSYKPLVGKVKFALDTRNVNYDYFFSLKMCDVQI